MTPELLYQFIPDWLDTKLVFLLIAVGFIVTYFLMEALKAVDELNRSDRAIKKSFESAVTESRPIGAPRSRPLPPRFHFYSPVALLHQHSWKQTTQLAPSLTIEPRLVLWHVADRLSINRTGHRIFTGCTSMESGDLAAVMLLMHLYNKLVLESAYEKMAQPGSLAQGGSTR